VLIVAAPIKRPYVWDLAPGLSAVGACLDHGLHVHMLEWTAPTSGEAPTGLDECVEGIATCAERIGAGAAPILFGHSLGGTLAAISAAFAPQNVAGLVLLGAPLCFAEGVGSFRDRLVMLLGRGSFDAEAAPGSLMSATSALAAPSAFVWSRLMTAATHLADPAALLLHARIERWALDEVALPGKLTGEILDWLYREDRFCRGALCVKDRPVGPGDLAAPVLAIVDSGDVVTPRAAIEPFLEASPAASRLVEYAGDAATPLQHLAVLVGREAHARLWPQILAWADACPSTGLR
jgi:polyhydroxyalkanoate synthase